MKALNIFSRLCSPFVGLQSSDVGFDCRLTVVSPSFDRRSTMLKLCSVLAILLTVGVGQMRAETVSWTINGVNTTASGAAVNTTLKTSAISPSSETGVWTAVSVGNSYAGSSSGAQLGKSSSTAYSFNGTITLSGSEEITSSVKITEISITCKSGGSYTIQPKVGGLNFASSQSINTTTVTTKTFTNATGMSGTVVIDLSTSVKKYINISGISITYEEVCNGTRLDVPDVTATPASGQIQLSWPAVTNATKYKVSWNGGAFTDATSPFTKTSLSNGTSYTWQVKAIGNGSTYCNSSVNEGSTKAGTPYTITWKVGTTTHATTKVANGDHLVLPESPTPCIDGKIFAGWSAATIDGTTNTKPTFVSSQTTINSNQTYYAVFATPTANSYTKGDINDLFPGQTTLIVNVSNNKAVSNQAVAGQTDKRLQATAVTITSGTTISSMSNSNLIWTVENRGQKYNFKIGSNYLRATGTGNDKLSYNSVADPWTLTANSGNYYMNSNNSTTSRLEFYSSYFTTYGTNSTGTGYEMYFFVPTCSDYFTTCASCSATPTVGAASLNGSFTLSSVPLQASVTSDGGTGCTITDAGFVWQSGGTDPTISNNKTAGTYSTNITGTIPSAGSLSLGVTYKIKAYATNGHGDGLSSSSFTLIPRSVTFHKNDGVIPESTSTQYVNDGAATALTANSFSRTGYEFNGWNTNADGTSGANYADEADVTASGGNVDLYVKWRAKTYAITLNGNGATSAGSPASVNATYNAHALNSAITNPTKTDYIFQGWNTKADGSGLTVIGTDGELIASVSGYTDASGNWTKDGTETLYAKWQEHTYTNYRTKCCDDLGAIDGTADMTATETTMTIKNWSAVSNVTNYTVRLYKWNAGTSSWDIVSGSTTGGSSGTQGTRTAVTDRSTGVTWSGIVYGATYKVTVQAIGNGSNYCDGPETAVTSVNSNALTDNKILWKYSIYIDDGTKSDTGWGHHYIESLTSNAGSVDIDLENDVDYYEYKLVLAGVIWYGNTGKMTSSNCTSWSFTTGTSNCKIQTVLGGDYTFAIATGTPAVSVTYPTANQSGGYKIYFDKSVITDWGSNIYYRIGKPSHHTNNTKTGGTAWTLVPGTDDFYVTETMDYDGFEAWQIANNTAWCDDSDDKHSIYVVQPAKPSTNEYDITKATTFQKYVVGSSGITLVPTSKKNTEDGCDFWNVSKSDGMLTHTATITTPSHGTITIAYTDVNSASQSKTATTSGLAHRTILTITATPATGYSLTSLTVDGNAHTSGNTYILDDDATIAATFTAQTSTVTLDNNSATSGSQQTVLATYDASMPLVTTADKTPAVAALTRTGYTFNGWWDNTSGGKQYYSYDGSTIASANNWDKTGSQTLSAQWIAKQYTITLDREGGSTGAESATATYDSGTLTGWSAPTKTGYTFGGYWSGDNGTETLVISTTGVLQNSVTISAVNWTDASGHWIKDGGATVYAKWTANNYTISYKDEGNVAYSGSNLASLPTSHTYGAATDLVDGVRSGYRFDGWFDNSTCTGSAITSIGATDITANTTYYAKWTAINTVTWHVNGSTYNTGVVSGNSQVPSGEKISDVPTAPADNTLNNCASKFMGWSKKNAESTPKTTSYYDDLFTTQGNSPTISGNTDFYAVFAEATNSGTYSDGTTHTWSGSAQEYSAWGGSATYTWLRNNNAVIPTHYYTPAYGVKKVVLNVRQTNTTGSNTVAVTIGGTTVGTTQGMGDGTTAFNMTFDHGTGTPLTGEVRIIVTNTSANTTGQGSFCLNSITLYEGTPDIAYVNYVTECADNQVRVTYNNNGGYGTACTGGVTTKTASYTICSTEPTKSYYDFGGWNDGTSTYDAGTTGYNLQTTTTFTAQWTPTTYDITYELDGGTNSGSNPATYNVTTTTITLQNPTRDHDRFEGWYSTYSAGVYSDQVTEIPLGSHGDITLYAKWTERHTIVFDADGTETPIYRASDENMEDAVAGQGSVPGDPSAPTACSSKVFMGWSESTIDDETDTEPADLMKPAAGTVNADKHYYAVWATESSETGTVTVFEDAMDVKVEDGTAVSSYGKWTFQTVFGLGTSTVGIRMNSGNATTGAGSMDLDLSDKSLESTLTITFYYKQYSSKTDGTVNLTCMDDGNSASFSPSTFNTPGADWGKQTCTVTGVDNKVKSITFTGAKDKQVAIKNIKITQTGTVYSYSAYATSCCATKVTLSQNSPEHGTIAFGKAKVPTCGDKEVSLTITPAAGYQLHSYEVATGSGKVAAKSVSPAISLDNNSSAAQNITLTFADEANGAYDVTASFSLMTVTSWSWTMHDGGGAIPDPLNLYVGQSARLDVAYTPDGVDASKKTYTRTKDDTYINFGGGSYTNYTTISGRASTGENTTAVTFTHADGPTKTVNVKVLPLPLTHFEDLVHGKAFADVEATIVNNALSATKTTPTSDDWTTPNANTCEENHLHLVGWIREDWPALVNYLNGTAAAPTTTAIVGAGNDGSGNAYFFAPNASINVQTFDGVTFYAVWAEIK